MPNRKHSDETKAAVVAALIEGQALSKVAEQYQIPLGTVKKWSANRDQVLPKEPKKREAMGDLLLRYLHENLNTLLAQNKVLRDPVWLKQQGAAELAVLHGVMVDKVVRLLESMGKVDGVQDT